MIQQQIKKPDHDKCVEVLKRWFKERDIKCMDFENQIGNNSQKKPDLLLPDKKVLIEVKTFKEQKKEIKKQENIDKQLKTKGIATWRHEHFRGRFKNDLEKARAKFRNFPNYPTLMIFFDLTSRFLRQNMEELIIGELKITVAVPHEPNLPSYVIDRKFQNRAIRQDVNREIGAIAIVTGKNTFTVFHNAQAENDRQIPRNLFTRLGDIQKIYIDDAKNSRFEDIR